MSEAGDVPPFDSAGNIEAYGVSQDGGDSIRRLTAHAVRSGDHEQLDHLLRLESSEARGSRNVCFAAHDASGDLSDYLAAVAKAWLQAEAHSDQQLQDGLAPGIADEVRYALYAASISSLVSSVPAPLLAALVRAGVWSAEKGLAYARQAPEGGARAEALGELASVAPRELMPELLRAVGVLDKDEDRARALASVAVHLPQPLLRRAVRALPNTDGLWAVRACARLAVRLGRAGHWEEVFALLSATPAAQAEALTEVAVDLPTERLSQTLTMVMEGGHARRTQVAEALLPLLPRLDAAQAAMVRDVALEGLRDDELLAALAALAPRLGGLTRGELRMAVRRQPPWVAARGFVILAGEAEGAERVDLLSEARANVERIDIRSSASAGGWLVEPGPEEGLSRRAHALGTLLPLLRGRDFRRVCAEAAAAAHAALEAALESADQGIWSYLSGTVDSSPIVSASESWLGAAPMRLAGMLPSGAAHRLVESALAVVDRLQDPSRRAWVLQQFLDDTPPASRAAVLARAAEATASVPDPNERCDLLLGLLPHADASTRDRLISVMLAALPDVEPALARFRQLSELARIDASPSAAAAVRREVARPEALPAEAPQHASTLVAYLGAPVLDELVRLAHRVNDQEKRHEAMAGLAPYLSGGRRGAATAHAIADGTDADYRQRSRRQALLGRLARRLAEQGHADEAITVAEAIPHSDSVSPSQRYEVLIEIAGLLATSDLSAALTAAGHIGRASERQRALVAVLEHVAEPLLDDVLARADWGQSIPPAAQQVVRRRRRSGSPAPPQEARQAPPTAASRARTVHDLDPVRRAHSRERVDLIVDIAGELDADHAREALRLAFGMDGDTWSTCRAVRAVAARLVALGHPEEATSAILQLSSRNEGYDDSPRTTALVAHVTALAAAGYLDEARAAALQLPSSNGWGEPLQATALTDLARRFASADAVQAGLASALAIRDDHQRAAALDAFAEGAASSPRPELLRAVRVVLHRAEALARPSLLIDLGALAPVIAQIGGNPAVDDIAEALDDVAQWWP